MVSGHREKKLIFNVQGSVLKNYRMDYMHILNSVMEAFNFRSYVLKSKSEMVDNESRSFSKTCAKVPGTVLMNVHHLAVTFRQ